MSNEAPVPTGAADDSPDEQRRGARRRVLAAAGVGHFVEWFDFGLYGTLAVVIGKHFFPSDNPQTSLLASFAVFGASFVVRPLGGLFFGPLGDRIGRRAVLSMVVLLTSGSTFVMGLLPTYSAIGLAAPVLLVLVRLVQGFAAGGESSGATALLAEYATPKRRGYFSSFVDTFGFLAFVAGSGLVLLLTSVLSDHSMDTWGWRLPFLLAGPLGLVGLYMRRKLEDTPDFRKLEETGSVERSPLRTALRTGRAAMLFCCGFVVIKAVGHWSLQSFMPSYLQTTLGFSSTASYAVTTVGLLAIAVAVPFMGMLSDRVGRKPVMLGACAGIVLLSYPAFLLMAQGSAWGALAAMLVLGCLIAAFDGASSAAMAELFPTSIRYGSMAIAYNLAVAVFGGATPYFSTWLIGSTGNNLAPAFYISLCALITLVTVARARETAGTSLRDV
ncbi:MFS transporter [Streptomyces sp. NPDC006422]|uniref:MFS transporter n=1 Tax=unclassified Streptomyces TaxID=2593676 RepID=UPI0033A73DE6